MDFLTKLFVKYRHKDFDSITIEEITKSFEEVDFGIAILETRITRLKEDQDMLKEILKKKKEGVSC